MILFPWGAGSFNKAGLIRFTACVVNAPGVPVQPVAGTGVKMSWAVITRNTRGRVSLAVLEHAVLAGRLVHNTRQPRLSPFLLYLFTVATFNVKRWITLRIVASPALDEAVNVLSLENRVFLSLLTKGFFFF